MYVEIVLKIFQNLSSNDMIIHQKHEITELFSMFYETAHLVEVETAQFFSDTHFQTSFHE